MNESLVSDNFSPCCKKRGCNNNNSVLSENQQSMRTLEQTFVKGKNDYNNYYNSPNSEADKFVPQNPLLYPGNNLTSIKKNVAFYPPFQSDNNSIFNNNLISKDNTINNNRDNNNDNNGYNNKRDNDDNDIINNNIYNNSNVDNIRYGGDNNVSQEEYIKDSKIKDMEDNLLNHTEYIAILRAENEALKKERDSALSQINSLKNADNLYKMQYDNLLKENTDLKRRLAESERLNKEKDEANERLKEQIRQLKDALYGKDKEIEDLKLLMQQKS